MTLGNITAKLIAKTDSFEASMDKAGQSVGKLVSGSESKISKIGGAFKTVGKVTATAVTAVAGTITAVTGMAVRSYADYEQMTGGVVKLFGNASEEVIKNAHNAYHTAGLSANDYMETVTSFSARLIQSLGGDTVQASKIADMAVQDMSDNVNIFGTNMRDIQNAYQGFAKQNFTMLDNLKLGYGGSAGEMARLINDTKVMGDTFVATAENVKDIGFDKYVEAIHKVQEETNITGTTLKEASETISGSINTAKASWENMLIALASNDKEVVGKAIEDFGKSLGNVVTNIANVVPNILDSLAGAVESVFSNLDFGMILAKIIELIPRIVALAVQVIKALVKGLIDNAPLLVESAITIIDTLIRGFLDLLPQILKLGITLLITLIEGLAKTIPELIPVIVETVLTMVETLIENLPTIIEAGIEIILALIMGLIDAIPVLIEHIPTIIEAIVEAIIMALPMIIVAGIRIIVELIKGLIVAIPQLVVMVPQIVVAIASAIVDAVPEMIKSGTELVKGLWEGIKNAGAWIKEKISGWVGSVNDFFKKKFGISSPSKVMEKEIGFNLGAGIAKGIENSIGMVENAMQEIDGALATTVSPTISPNIMGMGVGGAGMSININMAGANISSPETAQDYAEQIGDAIIGKLRTSRRSYV